MNSIMVYCAMLMSKSKVTALGSFVTLALLLLYSVSSLRIDSVHQLFHAENVTELHSAEKENDPCHKNIYHQQKESGCEHKSHITENSKCSFCEYGGGFKEILLTRFDAAITFQQSIPESFHREESLSPYLYRGAGRSPPQA